MDAVLIQAPPDPTWPVWVYEWSLLALKIVLDGIINGVFSIVSSFTLWSLMDGDSLQHWKLKFTETFLETLAPSLLAPLAPRRARAPPHLSACFAAVSLSFGRPLSMCDNVPRECCLKLSPLQLRVRCCMGLTGVC